MCLKPLASWLFGKQHSVNERKYEESSFFFDIRQSEYNVTQLSTCPLSFYSRSCYRLSQKLRPTKEATEELKEIYIYIGSHFDYINFEGD